VEDSVEEEICLNDEEALFVQWKEQGNDEQHEEVDFDVLGNVSLDETADELPQEQIVVDQNDVWSSGDTVRPVNDEEKLLLGRLREVFKAK